MKCFICLKGKTNCADNKNNHWHDWCLENFRMEEKEENSSFWTWIYSFF